MSKQSKAKRDDQPIAWETTGDPVTETLIVYRPQPFSFPGAGYRHATIEDLRRAADSIGCALVVKLGSGLYDVENPPEYEGG